MDRHRRTLQNLNNILYLIAKHFYWKEAAAPSRVCRFWRQCFHPVLWRHCEVTQAYLKKFPTLQAISNNLQFIQSVSFILLTDSKCHSSIRFTHLTSLEIIGGNYKDSTWTPLAQLIQQNRNLEEIKLVTESLEVPLEFWASFAFCPKLKYVDLSCPHMDQTMVDVLWSGCRNLCKLTLSINKSHGETVPVLFKDWVGVLPNMERLEVSFGEKVSSPALDQSLILRSCPNLRAVHIIPTIKGHTTVSELAGILRNGYLQHLEDLLVGDDFEDEDMAACLQGMGRVTTFKAFGKGFGELSFLSLMPHFATLKTLDLRVSSGIPGYVVQRVLESCPLLTTIWGQKIEASRIMAGKRWACLNLRVFAVCIILDSPTHSVGVQSRIVYVQLARLTRLHALILGTTDSLNKVQSIDLRRESGLTLLSSLRNLSLFICSNTIQQMSATEDINWVKQFWRCATIEME